MDGERIRIRTNSTKETLDPNHTQFIVIGDQVIKHPGGSASSECRKAFKSFLSNIKVAGKSSLFNRYITDITDNESINFNCHDKTI